MGVVDKQHVRKRRRNNPASVALSAVSRRLGKEKGTRDWSDLSRRAKRGVILAVLLGVAAVVPFGLYAGYQYLQSSPHLAVSKLELVGGRKLTSDSLANYLQLDLRHRRPNIIALDSNKLVASLQQHPWIRRATIKKRLPDRLIVKIEERRAAAYIALGRLYLVDKQGEVFKAVEPGDDYQLPIITGLQRRDFKKTKTREQARSAIRGALRVYGLFRTMRLAKWVALSEINVDRLMGYSFVTDDGVLVRLGRTELRRKLERLRMLYPNLRRRRRKVAAIFLNNRRHPERVIVRYRSFKSTEPLISDVILTPRGPRYLPHEPKEPVEQLQSPTVQVPSKRPSRRNGVTDQMRQLPLRRRTVKRSPSRRMPRVKTKPQLDQYKTVLP